MRLRTGNAAHPIGPSAVDWGCVDERASKIHVGFALVSSSSWTTERACARHERMHAGGPVAVRCAVHGHMCVFLGGGRMAGI